MSNYTIRDEFTEEEENPKLFNGQSAVSSFFLDPKHGIDIGYSYDISVNHASAVDTLKAVGFLASLNASQQAMAFGDIQKYANISHPSAADVSNLNKKLGSKAAISQVQAGALVQYYYINSIDPVLPKQLIAAGLSAAQVTAIESNIYVWAGLEDLLYDASGAIQNRRFPTLINDLAQGASTGNFGEAAYDIGFNDETAAPNRREDESLLMLGFNAAGFAENKQTSLTPISRASVSSKSVITYEQSVAHGFLPPFANTQTAVGNYLVSHGYYVPQSRLNTWASVANIVYVNSLGAISGLSGGELERLNSVLPGSSLTVGGLVYVPTAVVGTSNAFLSAFSGTTIVLDADATNASGAISPTGFAVGASLDGSDDGALFVILQDGTAIRFDANTWLNYSLGAAANGDRTAQIALMTPEQLLVATLTIDTVDDTASVTLPDRYSFSVPNITGNTHVTDPIETPDEMLVGYLGDLGYSTSAFAIADADYAFHHPMGKSYTVKGAYGGTMLGGKTIEDFVINPYQNSAPGAVVTGIPDDANVVQAFGDISEDTFIDVQTLSIQSDLQLASDQFDSFDTIVGGYGSTLTVTTAGTASIAGISANIGTLAAQNWGGTTLIGNDRAGQTLEASLFGDDTLEAGDGKGDVLDAGEGVDMLTGGSGGDTFNASNGLAAGSVVIGKGTGNVLNAKGDISQASVSGIQEIKGVGGSVGLSAAEFAGFTTIAADITAMTGGTYDLTGKTVVNSASLAAVSASDTTLIGDGSLTASGDSNDTLTAGNAAGDILSATGNGNDVLSTGDGARDKVSASGSGNDALSTGNGAGDELIATGTGSSTLTAGNGNNDYLTASNGTDTLTSGTGSGDTLTVTTGGNTLIANGAGAVLTAKGGGNTLMSGAKGATFDLYDDDNTATGGGGNDRFNLMGPSSGSGQSGDLTGTTIDGGGGVNTIDVPGTAEGDLSGATINNIQVIIYSDYDGALILTASQLSGLTSLQSGAGMEEVEASTAGIYSAVGLTNTDAVWMFDDYGSGGGVTFIDTNAAGNLLESTQDNDVLNSGNGKGDYIRLEGDNSTATTGTGTGDKVYADGSNDAVTATGATATVTLAGVNGTATLRGSGDKAEIVDSSAKRNTVNIQSSGDTVDDASYGGNSFVVGGSVAATGATLNGTPIGLDNYIFAASFGQDTVNNHDGFGGFGLAAIGQIFFTSGVTDQNLWFQQVGNNLQIDLMGTTEHVTVLNWFSIGAAQVESVILSNGYQLINTQVAALVSAMAAYAASNPGFNPTTTSAIPADTALQNAVTTAWAMSVTISDTAADVSVEIDMLQGLDAAGQLSAINLTNTTSAPLAITEAQLTSDATALSKIGGTYTLALSDVLAGNAASDAANPHVTKMTVTDTADEVAANLDSLETLVSAGTLSSITLTDGGTPTLFISALQMINDAGALGKIIGTYDLSLSAVPASSVLGVSSIANVVSLSVSDTAADVIADIATLQTLAAGGELAFITLTDPGTPTVAITAAQLTADAAAFGEITAADGGPVEFSLIGAATVAGSDLTLDLGNNTLGIGDDSVGALTLNAGASLIAGDIDIGADTAGTGTVIVDGSGTLLEGDTLAVGGSAMASGGSGQLTVSDGAVVSVDDLDVWENGQVALADGDLETDPVTMSGGTIIGNGVITGDITGSGEIIASGGTLELTGAVSGSETFIIRPGATLLLDNAVDSGVDIDFGSGGSTPAKTLLLGADADVKASVRGYGAGDTIGLDGQTVTSTLYDTGTNTLTITGSGSGGRTYTLNLVGTSATTGTTTDVNTQATLNAAIVAANAATTGAFVINLTSDILETFTLDAINLHSGVTLAINGQGHTLDGAGAYRGFVAYAGATTMSWLVIRHTVASSGLNGGAGAGLGGGLFVAGNTPGLTSGASVALDKVSFVADSAVGSSSGQGEGGAIFVQQGGALTIDGGDLLGNSVMGNTDGAASPGTQDSAFGGSIFLQGNQNLVFNEAVGKGTTITEAIADQTSSGGSGSNAGSGSVTLTGPGFLKLAGDNSYSGGTTIDSGTLSLPGMSGAGSGAITFLNQGPSALVLQALPAEPGGALLPNPIYGFSNQDVIDMLDMAFSSDAMATLSGTTLDISSGGRSGTLSLPDAVGGMTFAVGPSQYGGIEVSVMPHVA